MPINGSGRSNERDQCMIQLFLHSAILHRTSRIVIYQLRRNRPSSLLTPSHTTIDGRIAPRSGLAVKNFIDTGAGVIDADYRGQVKVLLFNHSEVDFEGPSPPKNILLSHSAPLSFPRLSSFKYLCAFIEPTRENGDEIRDVKWPSAFFFLKKEKN